jgi:hypothetical protein
MILSRVLQFLFFNHERSSFNLVGGGGEVGGCVSDRVVSSIREVGESTCFFQWCSRELQEWQV